MCEAGGISSTTKSPSKPVSRIVDITLGQLISPSSKLVKPKILSTDNL